MADELFVFARNQVEMEREQNRLVAWAENKVLEVVRERDDLQRNLDIAVQAGWSTAAIRRAIARAQKRIIFYDKIKAALEAGFQIVPDMDIEVFAVRTDKKKPAKNTRETTWGWNRGPGDQKPSGAEKGEGHYVSPGAVYEEDQKLIEDGKKTLVTTWATEFRDVDFPFALARVEVLDATKRAMASKIFDDLGVLPRRRRNADPMVIGRVSYRHNREEKSLSFVVAWFLDTSDL